MQFYIICSGELTLLVFHRVMGISKDMKGVYCMLDYTLSCLPNASEHTGDVHVISAGVLYWSRSRASPIRMSVAAVSA